MAPSKPRAAVPTSPRLSPTLSSSRLSPRSTNPVPNINPFSPLSPELQEPRLDSTPEPPLRYSRNRLLRIGKRCRGRPAPSAMGPLESWFGPPPLSKPLHSLHVEDPAIASIGLPARRGGGFGEGFGFGGGIGRGLRGRGGKYSSLSQPPETKEEPQTFGGQMGRFLVRNPAERSMRLGGDDRKKREDNEWHRAGHKSRRPMNRYGDTELEPAWMEDPADEAAETLPQFVPGQDMIAAHKTARARRPDGDWRPDKSLVSFFGEVEPLVTVTSKPKTFNSADYLRTKDGSDDEAEQPTTAFQSRFQRFFSHTEERAPPLRIGQPEKESLETSPPSTSAAIGHDHMSKLMGMLKVSQTEPPATTSQQVPLPLPPLPHPAYARSYAPDPLQLLAHTQSQQMSLPLGLYGPPSRTMYPQETLRDPHSQYHHSGPYPPPPPSSFYPHQQPGFQQSMSRDQRDMLATLFPGPPRTG